MCTRAKKNEGKPDLLLVLLLLLLLFSVLMMMNIVSAAVTGWLSVSAFLLSLSHSFLRVTN
jgi:hypothetical protein